MVTKGETIARYSSPTEAAVARDATARGIYARAFDRIVERINALLSQNRPHKCVNYLFNTKVESGFACVTYFIPHRS